MAKDNSQTDEYWKNRTLCSDENCIGVIGEDGRCRECGKKFKGDFSKISVPAEESVPSEDVEPDEAELDETAEHEETADVSENPAVPQPPDSPPDSDWENRRLCSDENCIGVIGPDGRCKECGKPLDRL